MKTVKILTLVLLLLGGFLVEAHAKIEPWCAPVSVVLKFSDQQGREAVRLELRSPTQTCSIHEVDEATSLYREPEMSVAFYGKAINIPNSCLMGFVFRPSDLAVSIGDRGFGIRILGKSISSGARMRAVVYAVDSNVLCNQSAE